MMDEKETRRMAVIEQTLAGKFKNQQAGELLHLSVRQVKRLKAKVRNGGATAILHGNRGRKPHNLVQLDASRYDWFGDGSYAHLHGAIDDATNQVLGLYFTKEEAMEAYSELVFQINRTHGLPHAFYADGRTIFFYGSKAKKKLTIEEQMAGMKERQPQFVRACNEVGIALKQAHSPQAKGKFFCCIGYSA